MTRELDAEIAEQVMGWSPVYNADMTIDIEMWEGKWEPSTNISDAWLVVEKMRERGYAFSCTQAYADNRYTVCFTSEESWRIDGVYHQEGLPFAICLAALEACNGVP